MTLTIAAATLSGQMQQTVSSRLAEFTAGLRLADVPARVSQRAKHLVLDAVGCALAARDEPFAARIAASVARLAGEGPRAVLGMPYRLPARDAALVNGMLMHGLDYDDTHAAGIVHLTVSLFPAVLAAAAQRAASGAELLAAYLAGLEAGARLAAAAKGGFHEVGFHPTGVVGAFACALAAGRVMGLGPAQLTGAQGIALSLASGNLQFLEDGSWTKRLHPGWAAACGITAAALAADELPAPRAAYEGRYGLYRTHLREAVDLTIATAELGQAWETERVAVKPFPACHFVHACADAAIALARAGVEASRVRAVRALVPSGVVEAVCEPAAAKRRPQSDYDAKFSIPYAVASGLARGRLGTAELRPQALREPALLALMDKVEYATDPHFEFPRYYGGEVEVTMDDGTRLRERVAVNRGHPERPLSNDEIEAKFLENCAVTTDERTARRLCGLVLDLDSIADAATLEKALAAI